MTIPNKFNRCQAFTYLLHNVTAFRCAKWHSKYVSRWFYYTCLSRKPIQSIETYTVIKLFWNTAHIALLRNLYMPAKECEFIYHRKSHKIFTAINELEYGYTLTVTYWIVSLSSLLYRILWLQICFNRNLS